MSSFDVGEVRREADEAFERANTEAKGGAAIDPAPVREIYENALMDWTDELNDEAGGGGGDRAQREAALVELWIAYAAVEKKLRQWNGPNTVASYVIMVTSSM